MNHIQEYLLDPCCNPPPEVERFLHGDCHLFTIAVHRLTGWQILAITEPRFVIPDTEPNVTHHEQPPKPKNENPPRTVEPGLVHAFCCPSLSDNKIFDAKAVRSLQVMMQDYTPHPAFGMGCYSPTELYNIVHPGKAIDEIEMAEAMMFVRLYYAPLFKNVGE